MKKTLDNLILCDLYQVKEDIGYIDCHEFHGKYGIELDRYYSINKIGSVIVYKSKRFRYNLKEIITGIPIDTLYEKYKGNAWNNSYDYIVDGKKSEYDTFLLVPITKHDIKIEELERYLEEHKDVEKYRNELKELLNNGSNNHSNKKKAEIEKINNDNLKVKSLLKNVKKSR